MQTSNICDTGISVHVPLNITQMFEALHQCFLVNNYSYKSHSIMDIVCSRMDGQWDCMACSPSHLLFHRV